MKILLSLLALLATVNASAQNVREPRLHTLDNGLRVITVEDHSTPLVSAVWTAHVGDSAEPPDFAGNSHYLEHLLLFRGTEKYPKNQIGEWAAGRGGYFNGYTWYDYTAFVLTASSGDLEDILDRHEQMMFHGSFSGPDFETEKQAVFEELRSGQDRPDGYLWRASPYHMYPDETFYSRDTIGTIETVQAATVERVREYYKRYYVPNNMTLSVVGDFDTDDLMRRIEQRFGAYAGAEVPETLYQPASMKPGVNVVAEEREVGKAYFLVAIEGPRANTPEWFPYVLLTEYLAGGKTSILYSELVTEQKLLEDVEMSDMPRRYPGGWQGIAGNTAPEKVTPAVDALWRQLQSVRQSGVPEKDVAFARQRLLKRHWQKLDDLNEVAESLAIADAHGDYRLFADFEDRLNTVTAADLQVVARKYLTPDNFFIMALFPPGQIPENFAADIKTNAAQISGATGSIESVKLPSGATLLHESRPGASMESYTAAIRAGKRHGDAAGLGEAVANMLVRETGRFPKDELQNYLDQKGFSLEASVGSDAAYISLQAPTGSSKDAMALLVEVLTHPAFSPSEWEDTRAEMLAALESARDQPQPVAGDLLIKTVYAGTDYGRSDADELAALKAMSAGDLKSFWEKYYKADAIAVAYSGPAPSAELQNGLAPLAKLDGKPPQQSAIRLPAIEGVVHVPQAMAGKTQTNLYIARHAPAISSDDWILWQLAERAIGGDLAGRLWKLRQNEGLAYAIWMFGTTHKDQPLTMIYMATADEKRTDALAAIHREIDRLQTGLTQDELDRVKVSYLANLNRVDRTLARRSQRHAGWWVDGFDAHRREQLTAGVGAATLDEVNRVIRDVLDPDDYVFVEAGAVGHDPVP